MSCCTIIGPLWRGEEADFLRPEPGGLLLCADGGYDAAWRFGWNPDRVIGDFDSMPRDHVRGIGVTALSPHKDESDTALCIAEGRARGYREFRIGGALGGRFDHSLANLQCLADCAARGEEAWLADACNRVTVLGPGAHTVPALPGRWLSLLAFTDRVEGVTLRGTEWELDGAELTSRFPLGLSNEFRAPHAELRFTAGLLTLILSRDPE